MRPETVVTFTKELPPCVIAMEVCCGAHHLARLLAAQGHDVRLMSPEYVRPYVKAQKNNDRDASAIAEAATRPTMRFVSMKTEEQLDIQTLHRARYRLVGERTALIADMRAQWRELDRRITAFEGEFVARTREDEAARRLISIPGIGVMNATSLIAAIGNGETFSRGRDLAAWLGLVPRQITTGGRPPRLVGISKRGNKYLRKLLIHGARAALPSLLTSSTPLCGWLRGLTARVHKDVVVVALANKLARIAWAALRNGGKFDAKSASGMA